jgi:hypothetical protein
VAGGDRVRDRCADRVDLTRQLAGTQTSFPTVEELAELRRELKLGVD